MATEIAALRFVLRHGTEAIPSLRGVTRFLESLYGASVDLSVSKLGEEHVLVLSLEVLGERFLPEGSQVLERGLRLLADLLMRPARDAAGALRADKVAQEKEQMRRLIEGLINDKGSYAAEQCIRAMCPTEPYSVFEFGALEDLPAIDGAVLEARRQTILAEAPVEIFVAGAFDPVRAKEWIASAFALERTGQGELRGTTPHPEPGEVREVLEQVNGLKQGRLILGLRSAVRLGDPDYWALLLMNGILGRFPHSKLFRNVREEAGLCYDASSSVERFKGLAFMTCGIDPANFAQARDLCLEQLEAIRRGEISDEEMNSTLLSFRQAYQALLDTPGYLINVEYLMGLRGLSGAPQDAIDAMNAVTKEQIQAVAHRLSLDTVYFLGPET